MVCVLQSKLPRSSAVFQLYCKPFFFPSRPLTFYTFLLLGLSFATALLHAHFVSFYQTSSGLSPYLLVQSVLVARWYVPILICAQVRFSSDVKA